MAILADIFIYSVASVVDLVSFVIFQLLCLLMLAAYHALKIPSYVFFQLVRTLLLSIPYILDTFVNIMANIILSSTTALVSLAYATLRGFLNMSVTIAFDLLGHLQTAVLELVGLMGAFVMNVAKLTGLSLYSVWRNFTQAVYEFISNM